MGIAKTYADTMGMQEYNLNPGFITPNQDITAALNRGGLVQLGVGTYYLSDTVNIQFPKQLTLRGAGRRQTVIECTAGFSISTEDVDDYNLALCTIIEGCTLYGPVARDIDAVSISWATRLRFQDVEFRRWRQAIYALRWWDSEVISCNFLTCGTSTYPVISLDELENAALEDAEENSNSIVFLSSHIERCFGTGIKLGYGTTGCRIIGTKFHGDLPDAAAVPHIELAAGSYANMIVACQLVNGGDSTACIKIDDSDGNMIQANRFDSSDIGIEFANSPAGNVVTGNTFGYGPGAVTTAISGDTTGNVVDHNQP